MPTVRTLVTTGRHLLAERRRFGLVYNPVSPKVRQNPYPTYTRLRTDSPVHRSALAGGWLVSRYVDISKALVDHQTFSSDLRLSRRFRRGQNVVDTPSMITLDPPAHTRIRRLVNRAFGPRAIRALEPRIAAVTRDCLAPLARGEVLDWMDQVARPLPVTVIAELLGIPTADRRRFRHWSDALARTLEPKMSQATKTAGIAAGRALAAYLATVVDRRRADPRDDLLSRLIESEDDGTTLAPDELLALLRLLLIAGHETTTNLLGNGLWALLQHPEQLAWLAEHPDAMAGAVEELVRFDSPVQIDRRIVRTDCEIAGQLIEAGEFLFLLLGSANRDPELLPDPDVLDIRREPCKHVAYGRGVHHCLGATLARVEATIAFSVLLQLCPQLKHTGPRPRFRRHIVLRGIDQLHIVRTSPDIGVAKAHTL